MDSAGRPLREESGRGRPQQLVLIGRAEPAERGAERRVGQWPGDSCPVAGTISGCGRAWWL